MNGSVEFTSRFNKRIWCDRWVCHFYQSIKRLLGPKDYSEPNQGTQGRELGTEERTPRTSGEAPKPARGKGTRKDRDTRTNDAYEKQELVNLQRRLHYKELSIRKTEELIRDKIKKDPSILAQMFESGHVHHLFVTSETYFFLNSEQTWKAKLMKYKDKLYDSYRAYSEAHSVLRFHNHKQQELARIVEGVFSVTIEERVEDRVISTRQVTLRKGEELIIEPFLWHEFQNLTDSMGVLDIEFRPPLSQQ